METASLQTPVKGKSRLSKALPAPPAFFKHLKGLPSSPQPSKSHTPPARKPVPAANDGPPGLPPKETFSKPLTSPSTAMAKPLYSPLPPVPLNTAKANAPLPLPSITRRPVAAGSPGFPSPDDDSSPLSSLLSAYTNSSNRSSDSTHISSTDGATPASSAQESYQASPTLDSGSFPVAAASSPKLDELFFTPLSIQSGKNNGSPDQVRSGGSRTTVESDTKQLLSPRFKDFDLGTQRQQTAELTPASEDSHAGPKPVGSRTSPEVANSQQSPLSQPQIWRRRSLKADKNLAVTELKLVASNGSSASISSIPAPEPPPKETSPTTHLQAPNAALAPGLAAPARSPLPLTPNAGFPGRNIRPVASRQQLVEENSDNMGQEVSRVKHTLRKDRSETSGASRKDSPPPPPRKASPPGVNQSHTKSTSISSPVRLPTPEYDAGDFKGPIVETILSPISPASSPELRNEPRQQRPVQEARDALPVASTSSFQPTQARSSSLAPNPSLQGLSTQSQKGLPSSPAAARVGPPQPRNHFPARTTSRAPESSQQRPEADSTPAAVSAPLQKVRTISEVGSVETIRAPRQESFPAAQSQQPQAPAREDDTTSNPGAERFPRGWRAGFAKDTVFPMAPVGERHHACLNRHRRMHEVRNTFYPLACQACGLKDTSQRFVCGSCNLRVCRSCHAGLRRARGDLRALLAHNSSVLVESSTEMEFDDEQAAIQRAARLKDSS